VVVLLDTHVWIWFREGNPTIEKDAAWIERMAHTGNVLISPISCWEVAQLCSKGRIALQLPCQLWVDTALKGARLAPLSPAIAVEANYLPGEFHPDPADRILVATARLMDATLVTRDARILNYALTGYLRTKKV
jgi:PIN domain nuclease of toxin-antitoxin system